MSFGLPNMELWPFYWKLHRSPEDAQGNWRRSRECFTSWPSTFQRGEFSSYLSRRIVPSINIPYVYSEKKTFDHLINRYGIPADLLMSVLHLCSCEFFSDLWERSLWGPYFVLNGCQFGCAVLCGLVPVCSSAIVRRSSRSPQGFGASIPVAWSHPILHEYV